MRLVTVAQSAAVCLLAWYVGTVGYLAYNQDRMLFPAPAGRVSAIPDGIEPVVLTTADGIRTRAYFSDAGGQAPAILFFHGNGVNADHGFQRAAQYRTAGYSVLLAEYRGYGGSAGKPSAKALKADGLAAHDWLAARTGAPVFVAGHSLGTGIAVHVAAKRPVRAVFLEAPYSSIADVAQARFPFVPVRLLLANSIAPVDEIGDLTMPIMIIHGVEDETIPIRFGRALFDAAPRDRTIAREIRRAGHNDLAAFGGYEMALEFFDGVRGGG
ncbi:alpha/beta hydrolase [Zhengella mangrovi]|nr:alpha/beta hydrolase [Zhengella mangrovi]